MKTAILSTSKEKTIPIVSHKKRPIEFDNDPLVTGEGLDPNMSDEEYFALVQKAVQEGIDSGLMPPFDWHERLKQLHNYFGLE